MSPWVIMYVTGRDKLMKLKHNNVDSEPEVH